MNPQPADLGQGFAQLASVSAVLGGFTVTFLAVVLTHADRRRVSAAVALSTAAAPCFFVAALGWSLFAFRFTTAAAGGATAATAGAELSRIGHLHSWLSFALVLGTALLLGVLGLGGWLRSRALGWTTRLVAVASAGAAVAVLRAFLTVRVTRG